MGVSHMIKRTVKYGWMVGYIEVCEGGECRLEHRYIWEKHNGVIPVGMVIHHKDNNRGNNNIGNLEMMSKSEHRRYHMLHISDDTRKKMSDSAYKARAHLKGIKRDPEIGRKISASKTGVKRGPLSAEHRKKLSEIQTGKKRGPYKKRKV